MHSKHERIAATVGIILLLLLYIINFFLGIFCNANTFSLFLASLLATFFIPVIIYCYMAIMRHVKKSVNDNIPDNDGRDN